VDQQTYRSAGGHDEGYTEGNIQEEDRRNNMRSERGNEELVRAG
jgi:hypothetical protein